METRMNESTRQMIATCYIAACDAAGPGVLEDANLTIEEAIESGAVPDPVACSALQVLIRSCKPTTTDDLLDRADTAMAGLSSVVSGIGNASLTHLTKSIARRLARLSAESDPAEIAAVVDMLTAIGAAVDRLAATDDMVDA
jgi:hypothetical protein